jgi:hypothetical protein
MSDDEFEVDPGPDKLPVRTWISFYGGGVATSPDPFDDVMAKLEVAGENEFLEFLTVLPDGTVTRDRARKIVIARVTECPPTAAYQHLQGGSLMRSWP